MRACLSVHVRASVTRVCPGVSFQETPRATGRSHETQTRCEYEDSDCPQGGGTAFTGLYPAAGPEGPSWCGSRACACVACGGACVSKPPSTKSCKFRVCTVVGLSHAAHAKKAERNQMSKWTSTNWCTEVELCCNIWEHRGGNPLCNLPAGHDGPHELETLGRGSKRQAASSAAEHIKVQKERVISQPSTVARPSHAAPRTWLSVADKPLPMGWVKHKIKHRVILVLCVQEQRRQHTNEFIQGGVAPVG